MKGYSYISTRAECETAARALGLSDVTTSTDTSSRNPKGNFANFGCFDVFEKIYSGCYYRKSINRLYFNSRGSIDDRDTSRVSICVAATFSINTAGFLMFGSGYVCHDRFGINEANLACRTLNFTGATSYRRSQRASDYLTKGFTIDNLECPSNATDITDCSYESDVNCGVNHNVRIACGKLLFF